MPWNIARPSARYGTAEHHTTTARASAANQWGGGHANTDHTQSIKWAETVVAVAAAEEKAEYVRCAIFF